MFAKSDRDKARDFIKSHHLAVLATTNENGDPATSAVYYIPDKEGTIRFVTKSNTEKARNISHNPNISMTITDSKLPQAVTVFGSAQARERNQDTDQTVREILAMAQEKLDDVAPIAKLTSGNFVVYEIHPTNTILADYTAPIGGNRSYRKSV